jgi:hypothetical protein
VLLKIEKKIVLKIEKKCWHLSILHNTFFQSLTTLLFNLLTTHFNLSQHFFFNLQSLFNIFNNTFQSLMALFLLTTYVFMKPFPVIWDILRQSELMSNSSPLHPWYTCKVSKFSWVFVGNIKPQKLVYHETTMQQEKLWVSIKIMNSILTKLSVYQWNLTPPKINETTVKYRVLK